MSWDPITRIVGSLGIYTKIDFAARRVAECHSTSSIFRGYSVFMKGKDPRDAHFITSRICGICGDNHATCACYAQNMAFGIQPPALAEWIINLGEAAEYMFDHNLYQDNLVGVDFCEQMVRQTNPRVFARAERTPAPHAGLHGYRTIADIMRSLNPFEGAFYLEALEMSRLTREMFCLMEGRHVHPSTLYPGGVGTVPSVQLFNDYLVRLLKYVEFMKRVVPLHDDLFDFFYEACPATKRSGGAAFCWAAGARSTTPKRATTNTRRWPTGAARCTSRPASSSTASWSRPTWSRSTWACGSCWGARSTTIGRTPKRSSRTTRWAIRSISGIPGTRRRRRGRRSGISPAATLGSCPPAGTTSGPANCCARHGGRPARPVLDDGPRRQVDIGYVKSTGSSVKMFLPKTVNFPTSSWNGRFPAGATRSSGTGRGPISRRTRRPRRSISSSRPSKKCTPGGCRRPSITGPSDAIGCGFHEAVRGVLSHHVVIRDGKIANYHPYPPTCWNASPRDSDGVPGPYEDAVQNTPIFEENDADDFKGIDILRAVRSFDPCLPCGVHMYLGPGRELPASTADVRRSAERRKGRMSGHNCPRRRSAPAAARVPQSTRTNTASSDRRAPQVPEPRSLEEAEAILRRWPGRLAQTGRHSRAAPDRERTKSQEADKRPAASKLRAAVPQRWAE